MLKLKALCKINLDPEVLVTGFQQQRISPTSTTLLEAPQV
jgi:hypothetical protein